MMNNGYELHQIKTFFIKWSNFCYIVIDATTKCAMIVDPSWELDKIVNQLNRLDANLVAIFLTHSHYDHVNLVDSLIEKYNPAVYMSQMESSYYRYYCSNLQTLRDEETIRIGNTDVTSILTPGHTAGGMCYLVHDCLFSGDTVFTEGCGICHGDGSSAEQMYESIQKIKARVPEDVRVYPGHSYGKGTGKTIKQLSKENIYFMMNDKDIFIKFRMRRKQKGIFNFK